MNCPRCHNQNSPQAPVCLNCGALLGGSAFPASVSPSLHPESTDSPERKPKLVTVLFCDLINSTATEDEIGPGSMHMLLDQFFKVLLTLVHQYGGTINQFLGDGIKALFGAPKTYENHPTRAVSAGLEIQKALERCRHNPQILHGKYLSARIGIHTGLLVVGPMMDQLRPDYSADQETTRLALDIMQMAEPGTVFISPESYEMVKTQFECQLWKNKWRPKNWHRPLAYKVLGSLSPLIDEGQTESDNFTATINDSLKDKASHPCPGCGVTNPPRKNVCLACGAELVPHEVYTPSYLGQEITESQSTTEGERKSVSVMFCQLLNSAATEEQIGGNKMNKLLNQLFSLLRTEVHRYGGMINQYLDGGIMALFGAPITFEDYAKRAVLAGLDIQKALERCRQDPEFPFGVYLSVRIGIDTGLVVATCIGDQLRTDYTVIGGPANRAYRIMKTADPNTISVSPRTYEMIETEFECEMLAAQRLKGLKGKVHTYRVLRSSASQHSEHSKWSRNIGVPLVGRKVELEQLNNQLNRLKNGQGGIFFLTGQAGMGKSRLLAEIRQEVVDWDHSWFEGRALPYGTTISYAPFMEIIKHDAGISDEDDDGVALNKLTHRSTSLFPQEFAEILPYLAVLLALDVPGDLESRVKYLQALDMKHQIFRSVHLWLKRVAQDRPVVMVFEDLHWIDQSSVDLVIHLFLLVKNMPILFCCIARPDTGESVIKVQEAAEQYFGQYQACHLQELDEKDRKELVHRALNVGRDSRICNKIISKTSGEPLFMEEYVRHLMDRGAIIWDDSSQEWKETEIFRTLEPTDTIRDVILARVSLLDDSTIQVLKTASFIGYRFSHHLLHELFKGKLDLEHHIADLQNSQFIRATSLGPETAYAFQHSMVQEVVKGLIPDKQSPSLHRRVADCIETLYKDHLEEHYSLLAYHYAEANLREKAIPYLHKAGDRAGRMASDQEALDHYKKTLDYYEKRRNNDRTKENPVELSSLNRKLGEALFRLGNHDEATNHLRRALGLLGQPYPRSPLGVLLGTIGQLIMQVGHRTKYALIQISPQTMADTLQERSQIYEAMIWMDFFNNPQYVVYDALLQLNTAEYHGLPLGQALGSSAVGFMFDLIPAFSLAGYYHRRAVSVAEESGHPIALGQAYLGLGYHDTNLALWENALEHYGRSLDAYWKAGDMRGWGGTGMLLGWVHTLRGEFEKSLSLGKEVVRVGQDGSDSQLQSWGLQMQALVLRRTGYVDEALENLRKSLPLCEEVPDHSAFVFGTSEIIQCLILKGQIEEALASLDKAEKLIVRRGLRGYEVGSFGLAAAEAKLIRAELASGADRRTALTSANQACRMAKKQSHISMGHRVQLHRLEGRNHWLQGRHAFARKCWEQGLSHAQTLGLPYDLGLLYLEMGNRLNSQPHINRAEEILKSIGAIVNHLGVSLV